MSNISLPSGFHGEPKFINYQFSFFTIPMLLVFIPILYIPGTVVVVLRIFSKFLTEYYERNVNVQLFGIITLSHFMCLLFFIADFFYIRLPVTGLFTSWCASSEPNGYLVILIIITFYLNYATMLFPCLVALLRLNSIIFPSNYQKINARILDWLPLIFIYPFFFTVIMFPGYGYCSHIEYPIFGSIIFRVTGTMFGWTNNFLLMFNTFFWFSICLGFNLVLIVKLIKFKLSVPPSMGSLASHRAEISLTLTTVSMSFSYLTNGMITVFGRLFNNLTIYLIVIRPFTNDIDTCVVPWVFYLTHPIFKKKSENLVVVASVERMIS
ncbi:Serpentine Receptor, class U [Caenorhabditis elegans]|uniref:Serpentine Receptor, class U n=1 Tax=Caenorhabditis elegans TaxID=6239 RepID=O62050_CAEEL|nr:Serpentine Receptor, class U [Caenorhabditis elegans]CAB05675.2 Serpentine Receptor, class U [Caenorhabditis elegans]|eukprot:NP_502630.2 Serpentine Receptor, class U [Caenorhabditis elegans]